MGHPSGDSRPNRTVGPTLGLSGPPGGSGASLRSKGCRTRSATPGPACGARASGVASPPHGGGGEQGAQRFVRQLSCTQHSDFRQRSVKDSIPPPASQVPTIGRPFALSVFRANDPRRQTATRPLSHPRIPRHTPRIFSKRSAFATTSCARTTEWCGSAPRRHATSCRTPWAPPPSTPRRPKTSGYRSSA